MKQAFKTTLLLALSVATISNCGAVFAEDDFKIPVLGKTSAQTTTVKKAETPSQDTEKATTSIPTPTKEGTPDSKPPVLKSLKANKQNVTAPGKVEITADVSDDVSGVAYVYVLLKSRDGKKRLDATLENFYIDPKTQAKVTYEDGLFRGEVEVTKYEPTNTFDVNSVVCSDLAYNNSWYFIDSIPPQMENARLLMEDTSLSFNVKN